ncbi:basic proline-rich protein-like [Odocoileus virginianus]|uniref:Basic proline-rich protein-like n=1 Tax=Odocoileus virginianus TaxID=9874 RepID=A0ABM4IXG7_ODOVR
MLRNVGACVLSGIPLALLLSGDPAPPRTPAPGPGTDGEGDPSFRGSPLSTAGRPLISPAPEPQRPSFHPPIPGPRRGADRGREGPRGQGTARSAAAAPPLHLLQTPRGREAAAILLAAEPAAAPPSHPLESLDPRESSSATANSGEADKLFRPEGPRDARMEPPKSTYPELRPRSLQRPSEALPRRPARGRSERAAGAGKALPKRPTPGGCGAARPGQREGAEPKPRSGAGLAAPAAGDAPLTPRLPAAAGSGITWPGLPAAAPDTGSRKKPEAALPHGLRRPPPAAGGRSPGLPSPGPQHQDRERLRDRGREVAPEWRRPRAPDPTGVRGRLPAPERRCAGPEEGPGCPRPKATTVVTERAPVLT